MEQLSKYQANCDWMVGNNSSRFLINSYGIP